MKNDIRICRVCGKEYEHEEERTITFMEGNEGHEYVACPKCFNKHKEQFEKKVKYRRK